MSLDPTPAQISARAHEIWLRRGSQPGRALDDWLQAERELRGLGAPPGVSPHGAPPPRPAPPPSLASAPPVPPAKAAAPKRAGKGGKRSKKRR